LSAATKLAGIALPNGWKVTRHIQRSSNGTGGLFSQSYEVSKDGKIGFLKAFDFSEAFEPGVDTVQFLSLLTAGYQHEKAVLDHCAQRSLSKVVLAVDHGHVEVPGYGKIDGRVYYLIFEMADGDVRCQMDVTTRFDTVWAMRALKDVALGLWQVHREMIAHQDAKPSNVLVYQGRDFKIADFGRSSRKGHPVPHDGLKCAGDKAYSPPELLYGHMHADFVPRRMGADLYMLGNIAAFLFSGRNVTGMVLASLDSAHHPSNWTGTYDQVLPYLTAAFTKVLGDLAPQIDEIVRDDVLKIIRELCTPALARRGHPRGLDRPDQYSLERYVSTLNAMCGRATLRARQRAAALAVSA
jgi:serine/threonine protein kinase